MKCTFDSNQRALNVASSNSHMLFGVPSPHHPPAIQSVVEDGLRFTSYTDEACIAPGVPVMRTLDDVLKTGDSIVRIEAMLNPGINVAIDRVCAPNSKPRTYQPPTPSKVINHTASFSPLSTFHAYGSAMGSRGKVLPPLYVHMSLDLDAFARRGLHPSTTRPLGPCSLRPLLAGTTRACSQAVWRTT